MKLPVLMMVLLLGTAANVVSKDCVERAKVVPPTMSSETSMAYEQKLSEATNEYKNAPASADALIWVGRRTAYLGRYKDAIRIFSDGIRQFPDDARMYRHRGHRYITIRCFDEAIKDLRTASRLARLKPDEVEPDGLPNARNLPTSTIRTNSDYHLGLAYYLKGQFVNATASFMDSFNAAKNADMQVAAAHWVYMSSRRSGTEKGLSEMLKLHFDKDVDIIENDDYHKLIKLYLGKVSAQDLEKQIAGKSKSLASASLGYGLGNWYLYSGDKTRAREIFRRITEGDQWASFGFIAAEAELR